MGLRRALARLHRYVDDGTLHRNHPVDMDAIRVLLDLHENMETIMGAIEDLQAAAARVESEAGQTAAIVETLRAAVTALQEQVAQGQLDAAAIDAVSQQLNAAADSLDAQGNNPVEAPPVEEPPAEPV